MSNEAIIVDACKTLHTLLANVPAQQASALQIALHTLEQATSPQLQQSESAAVAAVLSDAVQLLRSKPYQGNVRKALCELRLARRVDALGAAAALRLMHTGWQLRSKWNAHELRAWSDLVGADTLLVAWGEFWHAARAALGASVVPHRAVLRQALDPSAAGVVMATQFAALCRAFGPAFDDDAVVAVATLLAEPWFFGYMSMQAADRHLLARPPGTFVVRFAALRPSDIALAYVNAQGAVVHLLARAAAKASPAPPSFEIVDDSATAADGAAASALKFASAAELVAHYRKAGLLRWPLRTTLLREPWFFPTMTAVDSSSALAGCEPGTFLVRFSNIPGMYTVCFVDDRGKLCHTRIERAVDADVAAAAAAAAAANAATAATAGGEKSGGDDAAAATAADESEKYRFVSSKPMSETMSVSELINLHSLIFRRPFTHAARQRRMRSVVRVFDVASELPIPPDVLKHVSKYASTDSPAGIRVMFNTVVSDITALPSRPGDDGSSGASGGADDTADTGSSSSSSSSSTLRAVGGAVGGAVRAVLRRRTDASSSPMPMRTASPLHGQQGWSDRWLVLCDEVLVEVDDTGVRARLPLVTTWLYMKDAREPYLDAVLPAKERRVYRPAMPSTSVTAFVSRVRRRTLALLGGDESYEVRHVPHMFADHTYYEGSWREGVFDGVGVFISQHGRYEGEFVQGRRQGYGTYAFATGETYRGEWKADARHGAGVLQYRAQDVYERFVGAWRDDRRDGRGTLFWYAAGGGQLRSLTCMWSRGRLQLDRVAALAYDNGSLFCGEFRVVTVTTKASVASSRESASHTTTTASNPNAARTLGGMPHLPPSPGFSRPVGAAGDDGTLTRTSSTSASGGTGESADDSEVGADTAASRAKKSGERLVLQRHGFGAMYEGDGSLYIGQFSADQRHGNGFFTVDSGAELVGEWREGRPRGRGTLTFAGDAGTIAGTMSGPPEVFEPAGALQFSNAVAQLLRATPGGRRNSMLTGGRWAAVLPSGAPIDAGAALFMAQSGDKHDVKQATRRAGDAWRAHSASISAALARASEDGSTSDDAVTSAGVRSASSAASGEEQLVLALTQLMCTDDNAIGHAYSTFVSIFVEVRALPPCAAQPPAALTALRGELRGGADDADALLQAQSTPALLVARRNWRGDMPLQEALSDILGFTSAAVRRISRAFADVPALANMSQRVLDIVLRASDAVLFPKLYDLVFPLFQKRHKAEDTRLAKLCESIREHPIEVQFDMFGASARFCDAVASRPQTYAACSRAAGEMTRWVAPAQKLGCLVGACRIAEEEIARAGKAYGADELLPVLCYALVQSQLVDIHAQFAFVEEFVGDTVSQSYDACMFTHFTVALNFLASPRADDALAQATTAYATKREKIRQQQAAAAAATAAVNELAVVAEPAADAPTSPTLAAVSPSGAPRVARRHTKPLPVPPVESDAADLTPKRNKPVPPVPTVAVSSPAPAAPEPEEHLRLQLAEHLHESRIAALQASLPELSKNEAEQLLNSCNQNVELALQRASRRGRRRTTLAASDNMNAASPF